MTSPLWLTVGPQSIYKEDHLQFIKCVSFWLHGFCGQWEGWVPVNTTSWTAVVTPTYRAKLVCNRGCVFVLSFVFLFCFFFLVGLRVFVIGPHRFSFIFSLHIRVTSFVVVIQRFLTYMILKHLVEAEQCFYEFVTFCVLEENMPQCASQEFRMFCSVAFLFNRLPLNCDTSIL